MPTTITGPTLMRRRLGAQLRGLREASGKTHADVAEAGLGSRQKIWRIELGRVPVRIAEAKELARLYGADESTVNAIGTLALGTRGRGWWEDFSDALPPGFNIYVGLESDAQHICTFHPEAVDGLLQTAAYTRAVEMGTQIGADGDAIKNVVTIRKERQSAAMAREVQITAILSAGVLAREVGGPDVMGEQVEHLRALATRDHIDIRVLPWSAGAHPAMRGAFSLLDFENPDDPAVAYVEIYTGARYLEEPEHVDSMRRIFEAIERDSIPIEEHLS